MPQKTTQNTSTSETVNPWSAQSPYLTDAFKKAQETYASSTGNTYSGDILASFTPEQLNTFRSMYNYGSTNGTPGQTAAAGSTLMNGGMNAVTGSLDALANFKPQGSVESTIADAQRYADNPAISGMVDSAMRDATRSATEQTLPGIERSAAMSGNTNSSRTAIAQGIVDRGLAEKRADISSDLRGQAYSQGLGLAQDSNQFNTDTALQAAIQRGSLGGSAAGMGLGAMGDSINQQGQLFGLQGAGAEGLQGANQNALDAARSKTEYGNQNAWDNLARYYGIIGDKSWGSQSNGTKSTTQETYASPLSMAGAGLGLAGSLLGGPVGGMLGTTALSSGGGLWGSLFGGSK